MLSRRSPWLPVLVAACVAQEPVDPGGPEPSPEPGVRVVGAPASLEAAPLPPCADPAGPDGAFGDGLPDSGVDFVHRSDPAFTEDPQDLVSPFHEVATAGVVAADLDGDGVVDLYFPQLAGVDGLFRGLGGGRFEPVDAEAAGLGPGSTSALANAADFDGDGDLDLLVAGRDALRLLRNEGGLRFADVAEAMGLLPRPGFAGGSAWSDFDGDGDLDLLAGGYVTGASAEQGFSIDAQPDVLWRNEGDRFVPAPDALPAASTGPGATLHVAFRDLDDDADPDLLLVHDFGDFAAWTRPLENVDGRFVDRLEGSGLGRLDSPMGAAVSDLDGDGLDDLWLSDLSHTEVFAGYSPFVWLDVRRAWAAGVQDRPEDASWSVVALDLGGFGDRGLFFAYGPLPSALRGGAFDMSPQADRWLARAEAGSEGPVFLRRDAVFPTPPTGHGRGVARADLDGNGVPDLVVGNLGGAPSILLGRCTEAARLVVELRDEGSPNRYAVGARVRVVADGRARHDEVDAGSRGSFSGSEPALFFGLGDARAVDRLEVRWPDGATSEVLLLPAHRRVRITRR